MDDGSVAVSIFLTMGAVGFGGLWLFIKSAIGPPVDRHTQRSFVPTASVRSSPPGRDAVAFSTQSSKFCGPLAIRDPRVIMDAEFEEDV